jgi:hypothetical protein
VRLSAGLSFASLAEMIISVHCMGHTLEETAKLLHDLESNTPSSTEWGTEAQTQPTPVNGEPYYPEQAHY